MVSLESYRGIKVGDKIICIVPNYACYKKIGTVEKIEINEGAFNGWFHGKFEDECGFLLAGEEIKKL